jgi:hypothetical protein
MSLDEHGDRHRFTKTRLAGIESEAGSLEHFDQRSAGINNLFTGIVRISRTRLCSRQFATRQRQCGEDLSRPHVPPARFLFE